MGNYRTFGTALDRIFRNDLNNNFNDIATDINAQKKRVDDLIVGTPQPSEVVDARGGKTVLKDRLDAVDASLADNTKKTPWVAVEQFKTYAGDDWTQAIHDAMNSLTNGGQVILPNIGAVKCNIVLNKSNIVLKHTKGHNKTGNYLTPYDVTKPCVTIGKNGNSALDVRNIGLDNVSILGTKNASDVNSVGLLISDVLYVYGDMTVEDFGGDNIQITSNLGSTSYIYFNRLQTRNSYKSNINIQLGLATSAIFFNNLSSQQSRTGTARALTVGENIIASISNAYIQGSNLTCIEMQGTASQIRADNVIIDSNASTDVLINNIDSNTLMIFGSYTVNGQIKYQSGTITPFNVSRQYGYQPTQYSPVILGNIYLKDTGFTDFTPSSNDRILKSGTKLYFYNNGKYFYFDGSAGTLRNIGIENGTTRPSSPFKGQVFIDTTLNKQIWYDGTQWRDTMGTIV